MNQDRSYEKKEINEAYLEQQKRSFGDAATDILGMDEYGDSHFETGVSPKDQERIANDVHDAWTSIYWPVASLFGNHMPKDLAWMDQISRIIDEHVAKGVMPNVPTSARRPEVIDEDDDNTY
jgi:hypothetical protein